jgi:hypothetical protein
MILIFLNIEEKEYFATVNVKKAHVKNVIGGVKHTLTLFAKI